MIRAHLFSSFIISINHHHTHAGCGTSKVKIDIESDPVDVRGFENIIVIQNNPKFQAHRDSVRMIVCRYMETPMLDTPITDKRVLFKPFTVDMLDVISVSECTHLTR